MTSEKENQDYTLYLPVCKQRREKYIKVYNIYSLFKFRSSRYLTASKGVHNVSSASTYPGVQISVLSHRLLDLCISRYLSNHAKTSPYFQVNTKQSLSILQPVSNEPGPVSLCPTGHLANTQSTKATFQLFAQRDKSFNCEVVM